MSSRQFKHDYINAYTYHYERTGERNMYKTFTFYQPNKSKWVLTGQAKVILCWNSTRTPTSYSSEGFWNN